MPSETIEQAMNEAAREINAEQQAQLASSTAGPAPAPSPVTQDRPQASAATPNAAAPAAAPSSGQESPQATPEQIGWLQKLNERLGVDLSTLGGEEQALDYLSNVYRQAGQFAGMMPYVQEYQQHAADFQRWRAEQAKQAQAPAAKPESWWNPPEYDPAWLGQVTQDADGNLIPKPGYSPEVVAKIQRARAYRDQFAQKFLDHPVQALAPGLKEFIEPIIREQLTTAVQQYRNNYEADRFSQENGEWLFQKDAQGRPQLDLQGGYVMTPGGQRFVEIARGLEQAVPDLNARRALAKQLLQGEFLQAQLAQQQRAAPAAAAPAAPPTPQQVSQQVNQQQKNGFLSRMNAPPPAPAAQPIQHQPSQQPAAVNGLGQANLSFEQLAAQALREQGYDDNYFQQNSGRLL